MPEPLLILKAMLVAAGLSAATYIVIAVPRRPTSAQRAALAGSLAVGLGFLAGCWMLGRAPRWPPKVDLDRLLAIVLPLVVLSECVLQGSRASSRILWPVRWMVVLASARILLHNSVYLVGPESSRWSMLETWLLLAGVASGASAVWVTLQTLSDRNEGFIVPLILALAALAAGVAIMLSGYATGGQLAMPLAAAIAAAAGIAWSLGAPSSGTIGIGYLLVCCLVFVAIHFAELSAFHALLLVTSPLWSVLMELPRVRSCRPLVKSTLAMICVAIPLAFVLVQLQQRFVERSSSPANTDPSEPSISEFY